MEIGMKPPTLLDRMGLTLEPVLTMIERENAGDGEDHAVFRQEFEGPVISLTRALNMDDKFDRALLGLECQAFGLAGTGRRDLHRLARRFTGSHTMAVLDDGRGGWVVVLAKVEKQARRLLSARNMQGSGPKPPTAARRAKA